MDYINQSYYIDASKITSRELILMATHCIKEREQIKSEISQNLTDLKKKSQSNAEYAIALLEDASRKGKKTR